MRRNQFHLKKFIKEKENIKKIMNKKCLDCGAELNSAVEIIYHECDPTNKN